MKLLSKKFHKINRALHRDLGYLFIGLTLIYGISGVAVILRHIDVNVSFQITEIDKKLDKNLNKSQLKAYWAEHADALPKLTRIRVPDEDEPNQEMLIRVKSGRGAYNPESGELKIKLRKYREFFKFVNDIHYDRGRRFTWLALIYSFILVFFAISGALMLKGKKSFMNRGVWLMLIGIVVPIIFYYFF